MKTLKPLLLALPFAALLSGCVINLGTDGDYGSNWEKTERRNREEIASLVVNTSEQTIRTRLGRPDFSEGYQDQGQDVRVLFYRTQRQEGDGVTSKNECTPLVFRNGLLIGWGDKAYERVAGN
ncbi:MAG: DUF3192 domain-containing protein [Gammaproteobacteria bacterium]|nr:DUF3192 domain-containing protein [Gammaproteobacteria bacterium]